MTADGSRTTHRPAVLIVEPAASGGLHAHVADEIAVLGETGWLAARAEVDIRPRPHLGTDTATIRALRRAARSGRWDAIHAHGLRAGALAGIAMVGFSTAGRWATGRRATGGPRGGRPRLVTTLHNRTTGSRGARILGGILLGIAARTADAVLGVSDDLVVAARRAGAREAMLAVIPAHAPEGAARDAAGAPHTRAQGSPCERLDPREPPEPLEPLDALVIARLAPQKGLDTLLAAVRRCEERAPGAVRVRVAGDGPLRAALQSTIEAETLPVELLGRRSDVPALLAAADLVVSSAVWEGQPVALQEALHAGCAIVATDAGGTRAVTGDAARLVPVGDADALAREILALRAPERLTRACAAARRRAAELPGLEELATQLTDVLVARPSHR